MPPEELENKRIFDKLESIKRLLVVALANSGLSQAQLAKVLHTSQPTVSRMLPQGLSNAKNASVSKKKRR